MPISVQYDECQISTVKAKEDLNKTWDMEKVHFYKLFLDDNCQMFKSWTTLTQTHHSCNKNNNNKQTNNNKNTYSLAVL